jgi:RNase P/RNase MRP subunit p29
MTTTVILNNGFRYRGRVVEENDSSLVLDEVKLGLTTISKQSIIVRSDRDESDGCRKR